MSLDEQEQLREGHLRPDLRGFLLDEGVEELRGVACRLLREEGGRL